MGMLPHFAVVAHELGHAIQDRIKPNLAPHQPALHDLVTRITARLASVGGRFGPAETLRLQEIIGNWANELKADAVGFCIVGPAFFFALCGFLELAARTYGISSTHPPSDLRRAVLFDRLRLGAPSFRDVFQRHTGLSIEPDTNSLHLPLCPAPDVLFNDLRGIGYTLVDAALCVELVEYAQQIAAIIFESTRQYLETNCSDLIYQPTQLDFDLTTHLDPLCQLIPPIEFRDGVASRAASLASILNVGWAALLTRIRTIPPTASKIGDTDARRMERLHDLLLKGVELSEARLLWEEHS